MAKKKAQVIQISRSGLLIWIGLVVFIAGWMFVLGIMVGRGAAPVNLEVGKLEKELADLKAKILHQEQAKLAAQVSGEDGDSPKLGFYEALKSGKRTEPFKSLPKASAAPKSPPAPAKASAEPKAAPKTKAKKPSKPKSVPQPKPVAKKAVQKGRFTVQVAASQDAESAERLVATLRKKGYKAYQIRTEVPGKGVWYRVRVGAFSDRGAADKALSKLKASKYGGMVVRTR